LDELAAALFTPTYLSTELRSATFDVCPALVAAVVVPEPDPDDDEDDDEEDPQADTPAAAMSATVTVASARRLLPREVMLTSGAESGLVVHVCTTGWRWTANRHTSDVAYVGTSAPFDISSPDCVAS
jgi:hypothetical protein